MRIDLKAWLVIVVTFALGIVLGLLLSGSLNRRRMHEIERMRGPGGFVAEMERLIQPRDSAQAMAIRPYLEATDRRNRQIVDGARGSMRAELDSLRAHLSTILDADQQKRLESFATRGPRPPHGGGPPPGPPGLEGPPPRL